MQFVNIQLLILLEFCMMVHTCNLSTWEAEARDLQDQSATVTRPCLQKKVWWFMPVIRANKGRRITRLRPAWEVRAYLKKKATRGRLT
jgi:hypothetical protein